MILTSRQNLIFLGGRYPFPDLSAFGALPLNIRMFC